MKKFMQHGIVWIVCLVISSASFIYLKIDSNKFSTGGDSNIAVIERFEESDADEEGVVDMDVIKGITQLLIDIVRIKF